ncbi:MAG: hypothetical protein ACRDP6_06065, partial [Actinoallomurus sp.]
ALAAAVAVPAGFLLGGQKDAPDPPPARSPAPVDPLRGRFVAAPRPCSLITSPEAARLGAGTPANAEAQGCRWGDSLGGDSIEMWLQHFAPRGQLTAPSLAEGYIADKKRQFTVSAHTADKINSTQSGVTDVPDVADAAFVYDVTEGIGPGRSSTVWLRSSNVVVKVVYADLSGATDAARLHQRAIETARTVGARL